MEDSGDAVEETSVKAMDSSPKSTGCSSPSSESSYVFSEPDTDIVPENLFYIVAAGGQLMKMHKSILEESTMIKTFSEFFDSMEQMANDPQGPCGTSSNPFPLPTLGPDILTLIQRWLNDNASSYVKWRTFTEQDLTSDPDNAKDWKGLETTTVETLLNTPSFFDLFKTAEFLEMRSLVVACCKYTTYCVSSMTADELRRTFRKLSRDLTAAQEEEIVDRVLRLQVLLPIESDYATTKQSKDSTAAPAAAR